MTNSEVIVYVKLVQKRKPKNKKIYVLCSQPPLKKLIPSPNIGSGLNPPLLRIFKNLQPPPPPKSWGDSHYASLAKT